MPPEKSLALEPLTAVERRFLAFAGAVGESLDAALGGLASATVRAFGAPIAAVALTVAAGAVIGLALAYFMVRPVWDDQSWLLYAGGRVLHGAQLYGRDIVETNPPLIVWLSAIPMALAAATGMLPTVALKLCVMLLIIGTLAWVWRLLGRSLPAPASERLRFGILIVLGYLLAVYPWPDRQTWSLFGQREHLLLLLTLPYLTLAAGRLEARGVSSWEAALAGLAAGIGYCLKPHHLLVVAGVEALLLYRRRDWQSVLRPEPLVMLLTGLAYGAAIWAFAPGFFTLSLPLLMETYNQIGFVTLSFVAPPELVLKMAIVLVVCLLLHRYARTSSLISVLLVAACGSAAAYVVQHKGWAYQLLPAQVLFRTALGVLLLDLALRWLGDRPVALLSRRPVALAIVALSAAVAAAATYPARAAWAATTWEEGITAGFVENFGAFPRGTPVYFMSTNLHAVFAIVTDGGYVWSSRWPALWTLPAILYNEAGTKDPKRQLPPDRVRSLAHQLRSDMVADFRRWQPAVVMVERCGDDSPWVCYNLEDLEVDLADWFERDPEFAAIWSHYSLERQYLYYDVYVRDDAVRR
ncbi:MAG TPA: hypothetical protein VMU85_03855 [Stellaceae bacterium]|nr:hypothetical protein [Stellaceae bacterium]